MRSVRVRVPATSANLGPGFDCLALALDLWNEADFQLVGKSITVEIAGEGSSHLSHSSTNLVARAFRLYYKRAGETPPQGLRIRCKNAIPLGSGLGSSAAATLLGLAGASALMGRNASKEELLALATEIEGHADNAAAALYGGLVIVTTRADVHASPEAYRFEAPRLPVTVVLPDFHLPTRRARAVLPKMVSMKDAVFNLGRAALMTQALLAGDLVTMAEAAEDRLHQPYRLALIPGAAQAMQAARQAGTPAVFLSGAGPSILALGGTAAEREHMAAAMQNAFRQAGLASRRWFTETTPAGLTVQEANNQV